MNEDGYIDIIHGMIGYLKQCVAFQNLNKPLLFTLLPGFYEKDQKRLYDNLASYRAIEEG